MDDVRTVNVPMVSTQLILVNINKQGSSSEVH